MDLMRIVDNWMSGMVLPGGVDLRSMILASIFKLVEGKEQEWWILNWLNDLLSRNKG